MALINAFEAATPSPRACMVDAPVMGGTMAQMIDLVNHLGAGRSRRVIHANFTRGQATFADVVDDTDIFTPGWPLPYPQAPAPAEGVRLLCWCGVAPWPHLSSAARSQKSA